MAMRNRRMSSRKGQVALEFLHTYGWALLTSMVLAGILLHYNLSGSQQVLPLECSFLTGINCLGADVEENLVSIVLVNEFGFTLSNLTFNITGTCNSTSNTSDGNFYGNLNVLLANQQARYVFECQNLSDMSITEQMVIGYGNVDAGQHHIKTGKLEYSPNK